MAYDSRLSTIQQCLEWCRGAGNLYAGLSGSLCYCTDNTDPYDMSVSAEMCTSMCPGDPLQICGGVTMAMVFKIGIIIICLSL